MFPESSLDFKAKMPWPQQFGAKLADLPVFATPFLKGEHSSRYERGLS
jgi:hypothetical protein